MLKRCGQTVSMLNRGHRLREAVLLTPAAGFWIVAAAFAAVMAIGALPTPLYVLYERRDHFSGLIVTVIFAVYAVGVVASLFLAGHISDWFGRRRVIVPAIAIGALSAGVFALWPTLPGLLVARVLSGLSVGVVTATATAYLAELHAARGRRSSSRHAELVATAANLGGIGVGPLAAGMLAQFLPAPLVLSYVAFGILALALASAVLLLPETAGVSERPRYRTQRISVPPSGRRAFFAAAAGGAVALAVFGLFTSLAPGFLADTLGYRSHALAGFAAFVVFAAGAVAQSMLGRFDARALSEVGVILLPVGLAAVTAATWLASLPAFLAGGVLCGAGAGVIFKAGINTVLDLAPAEVRAEALATFFLASYLGLSGPILGLGVATQYLSARVSLLGFAGVLVAALGAVAPALLRGGSERGPGRGRGRRAAEINYQGAGS
jgi:hypothetical protein